MKNKIIIFVLILSLVLSSFVFASGADINADVMTEKEYEENLEFMGLVTKFVKSNYLYDLSYEEILEGIYKGIFEKMDAYSVYFTPDEYRKFATEMSGEFSGIGIQIINEGQNVIVVTPLPGSPAEAVGIMPKDIIRYVDGIDITGFTTDGAAALIRGEKGSKVNIGIVRSGRVIYFDIIRDNIVISSVSGEIIDNEIGYLKITQFNENTLELVAEQMYPFMENDIYKLIIDLRNNPGGSLNEVLNLLDIFVPAGPIAYLIKADGSETEYRSNLQIQNYEIAVLVNEGSASAAEIFAGAVKDRKAGTVIGTTTFGKGVVQTLYPLRDGSAIKLTTAEYFTAGKSKVQGIGVTPDIIVENKIKLSDIDTSDIPAFDKKRKPTVGIVGLDVLAAEKILKILGYPVTGPDGIFDTHLAEQIAQFQADNGLYSYGILDFSTQDALIHALENFQIDESIDLQLEKAVEVLKN